MVNDLYLKIWLKLISYSLKWMKLETIEDHLIMPELLNADSVIIDIGGNVGNYAMKMNDRFGSSIYIAEPDPHNYNKIPFLPNLYKNNVAISDKKAELSFFVSKNPQACGFNQTIAEKWGIIKTIMVNALPLNEFFQLNKINKIDLVKIDAEGSEIEILTSLDKKTILNIPQFSIEFHEFMDDSLLQPTLKCINQFKKLDFKVIISSRNSFSNVLFINSNLVSETILFKMGYFLHTLLRKKLN